MPIIGHVIEQDDGSYRGELKTLTIKAPLEIRPNREKKSTAHADFFVFSEDLEIGAAWWRDTEDSQKQQVFVSIAAPEFGRRRLSANLAPLRVGGSDRTFALLWHPETIPAAI